MGYQMDMRFSAGKRGMFSALRSTGSLPVFRAWNSPRGRNTHAPRCHHYYRRYWTDRRLTLSGQLAGPQPVRAFGREILLCNLIALANFLR
jgi:hypothetical protein